MFSLIIITIDDEKVVDVSTRVYHWKIKGGFQLLHKFYVRTGVNFTL